MNLSVQFPDSSLIFNVKVFESALTCLPAKGRSLKLQKPNTIKNMEVFLWPEI
jgi:hypothetical protein